MTERRFLGKPVRYWKDVGERVAGTFIAAFLAAWLGPVLLAVLDEDRGAFGQAIRAMATLDALDAAAFAGLVAVVTLGKTLIGGWVGNHATGSLLPMRSDPATPPPVDPGG